MFCFNLLCDCGYHTESVCWGVVALRTPKMLNIPIYVPGTGDLRCHSISNEEWIEGGEETDLWFQQNAARLKQIYGDTAIVLIPNEYDKAILQCPKCGCDSCRAILTGIV